MKRLEVLRKQSGASLAEQIRRAVNAWLDSEERLLVARFKEAKKAK